MQDHAALIKSTSIMTGAFGVSFLPNIDLYLHIGASAVTIVSGLLAFAIAIRTLRKK